MPADGFSSQSIRNDDGGPAFPVRRFARCADGIAEQDSIGGATLLDYAAVHIAAQLAHHVTFPQSAEDQLHAAGVKTEEFEAWTAHVAYGFAEALVAEKRRREREGA